MAGEKTPHPSRFPMKCIGTAGHPLPKGEGCWITGREGGWITGEEGCDLKGAAPGVVARMGCQRHD